MSGLNDVERNDQDAIIKDVEILDCDLETFAQLAKFAYMGLCGVADDIAEKITAEMEVGHAQLRQIRINVAIAARLPTLVCSHRTYSVVPAAATATLLQATQHDVVVYDLLHRLAFDGSKRLLRPTHLPWPIGKSFSSYTGSPDFLDRSYSCSGYTSQALSDQLDSPKLMPQALVLLWGLGDVIRGHRAIRSCPQAFTAQKSYL